MVPTQHNIGDGKEKRRGQWGTRLERGQEQLLVLHTLSTRASARSRSVFTLRSGAQVISNPPTNHVVCGTRESFQVRYRKQKDKAAVRVARGKENQILKYAFGKLDPFNAGETKLDL